MKKQKDISVIVLCYKAQENVPKFVSRLKKVLEAKGLAYELILVGNYHREEENIDRTPLIINELAKNDSCIIPVTRVKEGMFGWDVQSGLAVAQGDTVAFIDGDGQMPVEDIVRVYDTLKETGSDMVQTFRVTRQDGLKRVFISRVYNFFLRTLFPRVRVYDANSKPKIFTALALRRLELESHDWFIDAEIVIQATYKKFIISQIPTIFLKNKARGSFVKYSDVFQFLANLVLFRIRGKVH